MAIIENPYSSYRNTKYNTVDRGELLIMLYEALLRNLKEFSTNIQKKDYTAKISNAENIYNIISELKLSLNPEASSTLATNLLRIYNYISREITKANISNETVMMKSIIDIVSSLTLTWKQAISS